MVRRNARVPAPSRADIRGNTRIGSPPGLKGRKSGGMTVGCRPRRCVAIPMGALGPSTDVGNLDRNSGEGPAGRPGPSGDVVGRRHRTHPVQDHQRAWLELSADDCRSASCRPTGSRTRRGNSFWHAPVPPQGVGVRLHYRADRRAAMGGERAQSTYQDTIVRPNLPDRTESAESLAARSRGAGRQPA